MKASHVAASFGAGLLFALGLGLSGMTQPAKVLGFLDVFGAWDPSLAFVMLGAIGVHLPLYRWMKRRPGFVEVASGACGPLEGDRVEARVVLGAAIFGVGWGLAGYCPGPAVVSAAAAAPGVLLFLGAMIAGFLLHDLLPAPSAFPKLRRRTPTFGSALPPPRPDDALSRE